jgi:hypothetical protein
MIRTNRKPKTKMSVTTIERSDTEFKKASKALTGETRLDVLMTPTMKKQFHIKAKQNETTASELVRKWVKEYVRTSQKDLTNRPQDSV